MMYILTVNGFFGGNNPDTIVARERLLQRCYQSIAVRRMYWSPLSVSILLIGNN